METGVKWKGLVWRVLQVVALIPLAFVVVTGTVGVWIYMAFQELWGETGALWVGAVVSAVVVVGYLIFLARDVAFWIITGKQLPPKKIPYASVDWER